MIKKFAVTMILVSTVLTGCSSNKTTNTSSPSPETSTAEKPNSSPQPTQSNSPKKKPEKLVTWKRTGGRCAFTCTGELTVYTDGKYTASEEGKIYQGEYNSTKLKELRDLLYNPQSLVTKPKPRKYCESWVDGQDITIKIYQLKPKPLTFSSCKYNFANTKIAVTLKNIEKELTKS